jgi:hypothetical protein
MESFTAHHVLSNCILLSHISASSDTTDGGMPADLFLQHPRSATNVTYFTSSADWNLCPFNQVLILVGRANVQNREVSEA